MQVNLSDLNKLNAAVELLISKKSYSETVDQLSRDINQSLEPFVWSVIDLNSIELELPENIKSCWIFVLKKNVPSGCHHHPSSIQHMVVIKGQGTSRVANSNRRMIQFGSPAESLADIWYVIDEGVPHEFFPEEEDMIVVSFHTCSANELEEIACETGQTRLYERPI
jgi:mannose-6-phosphate isomerase-like protein (cupin superfamily)